MINSQSTIFSTEPLEEVTVSAVSLRAALTTSFPFVLVVNENTFAVYVAGGGSTIDATAGKSQIVPPGGARQFRIGSATHIALVSKSDTGVVSIEGFQLA